MGAMGDIDMYRYEVRADVVIDITTGLEWQREHDGPMTWRQALNYTDQKGGGWRLPTIEELITLINFSMSNPASSLPGMPSRSFWSSSPAAGGVASAWFVEFYLGNVGYDDETNTFYVRCVRGVRLRADLARIRRETVEEAVKAVVERCSADGTMRPARAAVIQAIRSLLTVQSEPQPATCTCDAPERHYYNGKCNAPWQQTTASGNARGDGFLHDLWREDEKRTQRLREYEAFMRWVAEYFTPGLWKGCTP